MITPEEKERFDRVMFNNINLDRTILYNYIGYNLDKFGGKERFDHNYGKSVLRQAVEFGSFYKFFDIDAWGEMSKYFVAKGLKTATFTNVADYIGVDKFHLLRSLRPKNQTDLVKEAYIRWAGIEMNNPIMEIQRKIVLNAIGSLALRTKLCVVHEQAYRNTADMYGIIWKIAGKTLKNNNDWQLVVNRDETMVVKLDGSYGVTLIKRSTHDSVELLVATLLFLIMAPFGTKAQYVEKHINFHKTWENLERRSIPYKKEFRDLIKDENLNIDMLPYEVHSEIISVSVPEISVEDEYSNVVYDIKPLGVKESPTVPIAEEDLDDEYEQVIAPTNAHVLVQITGTDKSSKVYQVQVTDNHGIHSNEDVILEKTAVIRNGEPVDVIAKNGVSFAIKITKDRIVLKNDIFRMMLEYIEEDFGWKCSSIADAFTCMATKRRFGKWIIRLLPKVNAAIISFRSAYVVDGATNLYHAIATMAWSFFQIHSVCKTDNVISVKVEKEQEHNTLQIRSKETGLHQVCVLAFGQFGLLDKISKEWVLEKIVNSPGIRRMIQVKSEIRDIITCGSVVTKGSWMIGAGVPVIDPLNEDVWEIIDKEYIKRDIAPTLSLMTPSMVDGIDSVNDLVLTLEVVKVNKEFPKYRPMTYSMDNPIELGDKLGPYSRVKRAKKEAFDPPPPERIYDRLNNRMQVLLKEYVDSKRSVEFKPRQIEAPPENIPIPPDKDSFGGSEIKLIPLVDPPPPKSRMKIDAKPFVPTQNKEKLVISGPRGKEEN